MKERLQKVLAAAGVASRRRAEELVTAGRVTVNDRIAALGDKADPERDEIRIDGNPLPGREPNTYLALNKPVGYVTSTRSTHGESTIMELIDVPGRVLPVGRLDRDTSGLLLLTNDGDWADLVTHPRYGVEKEYRTTVRGVPSPNALEHLRRGVALPDGGRTAPASVEVAETTTESSVIDIIVTEGKKRQIRLMLAAVGHPVVSLSRTRVGSIHLGALAPGATRRLTAEEVEGVREAAGINRGEPSARSD